MDQAAIGRLIEEIDCYLGRLDGSGVTEVREGIEHFGRGPARNGCDPAPPACGHLDAALSCVNGADPLRKAINDAQCALHWVTYDAYPPEMIGRRFPVAHAFASLIGGDGLLPAADFELGLFLVAPRTLYRDHRHLAPELYVPLTGPHEWRFGTGKAGQNMPLTCPSGTIPCRSMPHWCAKCRSSRSLPGHATFRRMPSSYRRRIGRK